MTLLPSLPDVCFPNAVGIRLCDDTVNSEGGANPDEDSPQSFSATVQLEVAKWFPERMASVAMGMVGFQGNPDETLSRPLRSGDQIVFGSIVLNVVSPILLTFGLDFAYWTNVEYVQQ